MIPQAAIRFVCTSSVLRRFNDTRKQYNIIRPFSFGNATPLLPNLQE
ncbi:hypothetical protein [Niabella beijingensis]|nr:hypothetical protein [Niabella beijingensis]MBZ4191837.1 hypothetical protein [Niabella beijingensis]